MTVIFVNADLMCKPLHHTRKPNRTQAESNSNGITIVFNMVMEKGNARDPKKIPKNLYQMMWQTSG